MRKQHSCELTARNCERAYWGSKIEPAPGCVELSVARMASLNLAEIEKTPHITDKEFSEVERDFQRTCRKQASACVQMKL